MSIEFTREPDGFHLRAEQKLHASLLDVFAFFSEPANLKELTPSSLSFRIVTPGPIVMQEGLLIDYQIRVHGLPLRWRSEITAWEPPHRFVDEQRQGPYRYWIHEHRFEETDGGVTAFDHVRYGVPGGRLVHSLIVKRDLRGIFEYRRARLNDLISSGKIAGVATS